MKIDAKDPDLMTIYRRIADESIDLQPDFQRDLVWNKNKKQGLIDTILRNWKFPPIFLVVTGQEDRLEVLDGQQRLNAICEFFQDVYPVDGLIEPLDQSISELHGLKYSQLPQVVRSKMERYSVRAYELYEYKEGEPYELFFRLNQGATLTAAEKRNTLFGQVRDQVKSLVSQMASLGLDGSRIGFNNNRLSYDDVMARFIFALQTKVLDKKITDASLVEYYRSGVPALSDVEHRAKQALCSLDVATVRKVKLSKPTLLTWLLYLSCDNSVSNIEFISEFENLKHASDRRKRLSPTANLLFEIYRDRSSSSVNDAIPVQLRLLTIYLIGWLSGQHYSSVVGQSAFAVLHEFESQEHQTEGSLVECMARESWRFA
jgi:hypothetical protein